MSIYGTIGFKYNEELYKIQVYDSEIDDFINSAVNSYKNNSIDGIKDSFNKIIWVNTESKDRGVGRTYNQGHLLSHYIECNDISVVRKAEIKCATDVSKTKKSFMDNMFEEDVDMSIFALNIPLIDLNFPKVNGELHLKIYNDLKLDIENLNYSVIFDIDRDELVISNEGDKSIINRANVNEFIVEKSDTI